MPTVSNAVRVKSGLRQFRKVQIDDSLFKSITRNTSPNIAIWNLLFDVRKARLRHFRAREGVVVRVDVNPHTMVMRLRH